jgi:hypothetical protein
MKTFLALSLLGLSFQSFAADSKVDYTYCKEAFAPSFPGVQKGFPFSMSKDGKINTHKKANYKFDKKTNTETVSYEMNFGMQTGGFGSTDFKPSKQKTTITIKRDKDGKIIQVSQQAKTEGMKTKSGLGTKNGPYGYGGGGGYPGVGMGFPGGGFNGGGGFGYGQGFDHTSVTDVKYKSGKCFPHRSVSLQKTGNHEHKSFTSDVELCRDLKKFHDEQEKKGSKLGDLRSCYESYQKEAQKVMDAHLERNDDIYNPDGKSDDDSPWGKSGPYGFNDSDAEFSDGTAGGAGYGGYGGFAGSIDNIVQSKQFASSAKTKMLNAYCNNPYSPVKKMIEDDELFVKDEVPASVGGEGSGGDSKSGKTK